MKLLRSFKSSLPVVLNLRIFMLLIFVITSAAWTAPVLACSTFKLVHGNKILIAHNLDQEFYTPGMVYVNLRGMKKRSLSGHDINMTEDRSQIIEWVARYGSVSFTNLGQEFPDSGINEAGLVISEMGLGQTKYTIDPTRPMMMTSQWIQYQLDNFATVQEILDHLPEINIDGYGPYSPIARNLWHFFIADKRGDMAIVEFLDGEPVIYYNEQASVPVLCNAPYGEELARLGQYDGFTGWLKENIIDRKRDLRFVKCVSLLENYSSDSNKDPVSSCFDMLGKLQFESTKQWSIVYDLTEMRVYFRTAGAVNIRHFDLGAFDFSAAGQQKALADIDINWQGDVSHHFTGVNDNLNRRLIERSLKSLVEFCAHSNDRAKIDEYLINNYNENMEKLIRRNLGLIKMVKLD